MPYFFKSYTTADGWAWILVNAHSSVIAKSPGFFETEEDCDAGISSVRESLAMIEIIRDPTAPSGPPV